MKRIFVVMISVLLFALSSLWGQQIKNVTIGYEMDNEGPFPTSAVFHNDTVIIRWDKININGNVAIELYRQNHSLSMVIAPSYPAGDLPKSLFITPSISLGNYYIKVSQGAVSGKSPVFTVKGVRKISDVVVFLEAQPTPVFFQAGQTIAIRWNAQLLGKVRVVMRSVSTKAFQLISEGRPFNDVPASYKLPLMMKGEYRVEVSQGAIKSHSKPFTVKNRLAPLPLHRKKK